MLQKPERGSASWLQGFQNVIVAILLLGCLPGYAEVLSSCPDADTCWFNDNNGPPFKVRLYGVDAPEKDQPYGKEAQQFITRLLQNQSIQVECRGQSFDRRTCDLFLDGQDVSALLVKAGYAWDYPEYSDGKYAKLQAAAKANKQGLWQDPNPTSPYCWRWTGTKECNDNQQYQP